MGPTHFKEMSERLSPRCSDLKRLCDTIAKAVTSAIREMVGTAEGGLIVTMGADGTPTKRIDRAAEDAVLAQLRASGLGFKVLSEEIGEVLIGEKPDYFLHLDPLDGTFNAIKGYPSTPSPFTSPRITVTSATSATSPQGASIMRRREGVPGSIPVCASVSPRPQI